MLSKKQIANSYRFVDPPNRPLRWLNTQLDQKLPSSTSNCRNRFHIAMTNLLCPKKCSTGAEWAINDLIEGWAHLRRQLCAGHISSIGLSVVRSTSESVKQLHLFLIIKIWSKVTKPHATFTICCEVGEATGIERLKWHSAHIEHRDIGGICWKAGVHMKLNPQAFTERPLNVFPTPQSQSPWSYAMFFIVYASKSNGHCEKMEISGHFRSHVTSLHFVSSMTSSQDFVFFPSHNLIVRRKYLDTSGLMQHHSTFFLPWQAQNNNKI